MPSETDDYVFRYLDLLHSHHNKVTLPAEDEFILRTAANEDILEFRARNCNTRETA